MKYYYPIGDFIFSMLAIGFLINGQLTNALIAWGISELYSVQKKQWGQ